MSEKRFRANFDVSIYDSETEEYISVNERGLEEIAKRMNEQQAIIEHLTVEKFKENKRFTKLLSEQQATINELKAKLREKEEDERLYANEILELRETNKEHIKFKSLGGDY